MQVVHKDALMEVERGENGKMVLNGWTQTEISEEKFYEEYVAVRKINKTRKLNIDKMSMAKGYEEMGYLVDESKNDNYIFDTTKLSEN